MAEKKKILVIAFKSLRDNKRIYNRLHLFKQHFDVYTAGFQPSGIKGITHFEIIPTFKKMSFLNKAVNGILFLFRLFEISFDYIYNYNQLAKAATSIQFDLIVFHDLKTLPLKKRLFGNFPDTKILFDAHEFYLKRGNERLIDKLFLAPYDAYLYQRYFLNLNNVVTVGSYIAAAYEKELNRKVEVIYSAAKFYELAPTAVDPKKIKMIHHGMADPNRQTELMIEMMNDCDERFHLDIMLKGISIGSQSYIEKLKQLAAKTPRVRILEPVDSEEIIAFSNQYDIAVYLLPDTLDNFRYAMPNKFFEFIQSRLMIAISPNVEMKQITQEHRLGVVAPNYSPKALAAELNKCSADEISRYKQNTHLAASKLCSEAQHEKVLSIVNNLLK